MKVNKEIDMQTLTWQQFVENVQQWAQERGIYEYSTPNAQLLKALSEVGELADAVIKNDREGLIDALGDVAVCYVNFSYLDGGMAVEYDKFAKSGFDTNKDNIGLLAIEIGDLLTGIYCDHEPENILNALNALAIRNNLDFLECCTSAWEAIKTRKGKMVAGGAFVKDED